MYRKYYGLKADPFRLSPDHAFCLQHRSFAKAKAYMRYAMHRNEGFVMITGAPGTGKTTLIDDLLAGIRDSGFSIARLVSAQVEADDILRMVAAEFGLTVRQTEKSEILRLLFNQFTLNFKQGKRSLLIVDEAQGLGLSALEELRLLTNMRIGGQPML
ncbi:MAG TPA: ATP-binding protein, partial [Gammaproteobacteria bacterium]|nr:ATP-binding protein [Gammaproteobacteria bacterium]